MGKILGYFKKKPLSILLIFALLAIIAELGHWDAVWVFVLAALGMIPLAGFIGEATEAIAHYTGPRIGGLLNATLGNAAELIITLVALRAGLLDLVKASITGSILGNLLLVLGFSMLLGGLKNGIQTFDRRQASNHATLLVLVIVALVIPSLFSHSIGPDTDPKVEGLTIAVSVIMLILYAIGVIFSLRTNNSPIAYDPHSNNSAQVWSIRFALLVLALSTFGVVVLSEFLVGATEAVVVSLGLSEFFLGVILVPIVGNVAEHLVAVQVAIKNKMDLSVEIAISSSLQVALLVAPLLVFISLFMGNPMQLIFNQFELLALGGGVGIAALVSLDGESNWLEGATLLAVYLILGFAFFFLPTV